MLTLKLESMLEQRLNVLKLINVLLKQKTKERFVSKVCLDIDVSIKRYGIIIQYHSLLHLILLNAKTLLDTLMVQITQF